ncbi:Holliday junction resolvase RuvX [Terrabacter sp. NPDC000476]|uniref:Holliday junction resolvase RuvX n=1 Tax=Terrabacter sp. NPDC000476 TaxID=3154258 RepID=UPI00332D86D6
MTEQRSRPGARVGVDVGNARVGVAASDASGVFAHPVRTLPRDVAGGSDLEAVVALVEELGAVEVVVGLPRLLSGEEGESARIAREYARELAVRLGVRAGGGAGTVGVRLVDERLTTVDAHRRLRDSGVPGRGQRAVIDQAAAVLILQTALDTEALSGRPPGETLSAEGKRKKERRR